MKGPAGSGASGEGEARPFRVLGLAGSLRKDSFNRRLLSAAVDMAPTELAIATHRIGRVPPYDADVEAAGRPPSVERLRQAIETADGLLIVTPEYNAGIPGVLKNAIDWASRPAYRSPLVGKPVALVAATPGRGGARGALGHLREVLESTLAEVIEPAVSVSAVHEKLDGEDIVDEGLRREIDGLLLRLEARIAEGAGERPAETGGSARRASG